MVKRFGEVLVVAVLLVVLPAAGEGPVPLPAQGIPGISDGVTPSSDDTNLPRLLVPIVSPVIAKNSRRSPCLDNMADMGGYCIDQQPNSTPLNWYAAADSCQARGKRLCSNEEWLQACDAAPLNGVKAMPGGGPEWLSNWVFDTSDQVFDAVEHGYFRCRTSSQPRPSSRPFELRQYRCCL